ncbi:MAG: 4-hydroxy-tetrahydrodipicolinate synthase [Cryomorphaceae bacterium]|nr:4-hydroxy-tetrahydrodipicolinate synthase [Cryomorphaceae bacterium]
MNSNRPFSGTGIAMVTPFDADKQVDFAALESLTNHLVDNGVNYLVVMGTTGESATLNKNEKLAVLNRVIKINNGRCQIVYGLGGNDTVTLAKEMEVMNIDGVSAFLSVSPYYNKPTQEGIYQHYKTLSEASPLPIILYNVPGRTGSNMTAETTLRLARDFSNIVAIKEASGNMEQVMQIINERPDDFSVISGDDNLTFPMICLGGDGVISVSGQAYPAMFSKMVSNALNGSFEEARKTHYKLFEFTQLLFAEGNPGGIKAALDKLGICKDHMRLPLYPISIDTRKALMDVMSGI